MAKRIVCTLRRSLKIFLQIFLLLMLMAFNKNLIAEEQGLERSADAVVLYHFDQGSGTRVKDSSGKGNDGTIHGGATWTTGRVGSALEFDGVNDYVEIPSSPSLDIKDGITIEAWINVKSPIAPSPGKEHRVGIVVYTDSRARLWLSRDDTTDILYFEVRDSKNNWFYSPHVPIELDRWNHIAATYDQKTVKLYVNGFLFQDYKKPAYDNPLSTCSSYNIQVGADAKLPDRFFKGIIDELIIYNKAISKEEVENHYKGYKENQVVINRQPSNEELKVTTSLQKETRQDPTNLIVNSSFDVTTNTTLGRYPGIPDGWSMYSRSPSVVFGADDKIAYHGDKSLKIHFPDLDISQFLILESMQISVEPGATYTFSAYIRSDNPEISVLFGYYGSLYGFKDETTISSSWKRYTSIIELPQNFSSILRPRLKISGKRGSLWIDAVQLEKGKIATSYKLSHDDLEMLKITKKNLEPRRRPIPSLKAVKTDSPPIVDGKLNDACWKTSAKIREFVLVDGSLPTEQTEAFIVYDDDNLYIGMICYDSQIDGLRAEEKKRDGNIFNEDCIEIFLDTNHDHQTYYHFALNSLGTKYDADENFDKNWNSDFQAKTSISFNSWIVEVAIPFKDLNISYGKNKIIGLNLNREYPRKKELSCWSATYRGFHTPLRFGDLTELDLHEIYTGNVTKLTKDNVLLLNGKPFFPVFMWEVSDENVLEDVAKNGITTVMSSAWLYWQPGEKPNLGVLKSYLDRAYSNNIGVFVDVRHCLFKSRNRELRDKPDLETLKKIVLAVKDHPALLGWYLADEPFGFTWTEKMSLVYEFIKKLDPHHIAWSLVSQPCYINFIFDVVDVVGLDPYPIPRFSPTMVSDYMEEGKIFTENRKPIWIVCQAFGGSEWFVREPTPAEERCMTYLAVIHGAKGIGYFLYKPMYIPLWKELGRLSKELAELTPILLSPEVRQDISVNSDVVHMLFKKYKGKNYLITVNSSNESIDVEFKLDDIKKATIEVLFESRRLKIDNNLFKDKFNPFERHIYKY